MMLARVSCLILCWLELSVQAQEQRFTSQIRKEACVTFQSQDPATSACGNAILIHLAAPRDMNPRKLKIGISFVEELNIRLKPMQSPEIRISMNGITPFLSLDYRGFSMNDVLFPSRVSCHLNLIDLPDSNILRQYTLADLDIGQMATGYTTTEIPVVEVGKMTVTLSDYRFSYDEHALRKFREKLQMVNDYYAAVALMDSLLMVAEGYLPKTVGDLPEKYIRLLEISKVIRYLEGKKIADRLSLQINDPEQFLEKFIRLDKFSRSASMTFEQQLNAPGPLEWSGDLQPLASAFIAHLQRHIQKSMRMDGIRGNIYQEYLGNFFQVPGFQDDTMIFQRLLAKMYPGMPYNSAFQRVAQVVWNTYLDNAGELIREKKFAEALLLLQHAGSFRAHSPGGLDIEEFNSLHAAALKGIYGSYLGIAESCIDQQKFGMAEQYIAKAREYKESFPGLIPSDTLFRRVFRKLFSRWLEECDRMLTEKYFQEALDCYELFAHSHPADMVTYVEDHLAWGRRKALRGLFFAQADRIPRLLQQRKEDSALACYERAGEWQALIPGDPETNRTWDELNARMLPLRYRKLADRGIYLHMTYNHEEAFLTFSTMKQIGERIGMDPDPELERMYLESYKYHLLNEISMATGMIWKDQLDLAREYAREVESVMDVYNLDMDPDIQAALASYRQKIDQKLCRNLLEEVTMLSARAQRNIELKQFDLAVTQLGEGRLKAQQHPECGIPVKSITDTINHYISAAFYQEKLKQIQQLVAIGNYPDAIRLASDNELFYRNKQLHKLGVPFTTTLEFVIHSSRNPFTEEAIRFFVRSGSIQEAWICLSELEAAGVQARSVTGLQEMVGAALGARDSGTFASGDPVQQVHTYTRGNRWFAKFEQAYTHQWKQVQSGINLQNSYQP